MVQGREGLGSKYLVDPQLRGSLLERRKQPVAGEGGTPGRVRPIENSKP